MPHNEKTDYLDNLPTHQRTPLAPPPTMITSAQAAAEIASVGGFAPMSVSFTAPNKAMLILRVDIYRGFKAYWIESASGKCLTGHKFYKPEIVAEILF